VLTPSEILQNHWGYDSFRPLQAEIVDSILDRQDTMALMPTGGGKSICFQVPGIVLPGLTLVISPLIALMRDQVDQLNRRQIPATFINSSDSFNGIDRKLQMAMDGRYKFLYVAPERLGTEIFQARLQALNVSLVAIDEAHCISQWGYDFRPAYLKIAELRKKLPKVPFAAFTATATPEVKNDILQKLELKAPKVFQQSFRRSNLSYKVRKSERVADEIVDYIQRTSGAGIVYARTRKGVKSMADLLRKAGITAAAYHGGMSNDERNQVQGDWISNKTRVVTATNAFGMGIDKPDVRFVLHLNMPADLESYYQEAGRGGRDGKPSEAICFLNEQDLSELETWVNDKYPAWETLQNHFELLCNAFSISNDAPPSTAFPLDLQSLAAAGKTSPIVLHHSIRLLDQMGVLELLEKPEDFGYLMLCVGPEDVLSYKKRYPDLANLLDFMLRSLGGEVYSNAVPFLPSTWLKRLQTDLKTLNNQFDNLHRKGIIQYQAPVSVPTLRFLIPRQRLHKQIVGWDNIEVLKQKGLERYQSILNYLHAPSNQCRSQLLEQYFGESASTTCGMCDHCLARQSSVSTSELKSRIKKEILGWNPGDAFNIDEWIGLNGEDRPVRLQVVREMIDEGLLIRVGGFHVKKA